MVLNADTVLEPGCVGRLLDALEADPSLGGVHPRAIPRIAAVEVGSLLRAARQRRFVATLRGKLEALGRMRALLRERRELRRDGDLAPARRWLGRR